MLFSDDEILILLENCVIGTDAHVADCKERYDLDGHVVVVVAGRRNEHREQW